MLRKLALGYAALFCASAIWAWVVEIAYFGSDKEHLAAPILMGVWSLPTALLTVNMICTEANGYCGQYGQMALATACGAAQAGVLLLAARRLQPSKAEK